MTTRAKTTPRMKPYPEPVPTGSGSPEPVSTGSGSPPGALAFGSLMV